MKLKFTFLLFILINGVVHLTAQTVNIPDPGFLAKLLEASPSNDIAYDLNGQPCKVDTNGDGLIQVSEAENISFLRVGSLASLEGINSFKNLKNLECNGNNLLTSLNISGLHKLESIACYENQLISLNLSDLPNLTRLECFNNQLSSLNVSGLPKLSILDCGKNSLTSLDVSNNITLIELECGENPLPSIDVSNNINLSSLYVNIAPQLTYLNIKNGVTFNGPDPIQYLVTGAPILANVCCNEADVINVKSFFSANGMNPTVTSDCASLSIDQPVIKTDKPLVIAPNPAKDKIQFSIEAKQVQVYDLNGKLIQSSIINSQELNISHLKTGTYLLKVQTKQGTYTQKLIKL